MSGRGGTDRVISCMCMVHGWDWKWYDSYFQLALWALAMLAEVL